MLTCLAAERAVYDSCIMLIHNGILLFFGGKRTQIVNMPAVYKLLPRAANLACGLSAGWKRGGMGEYRKRACLCTDSNTQTWSLINHAFLFPTALVRPEQLPHTIADLLTVMVVQRHASLSVCHDRGPVNIVTELLRRIVRTMS